MMGRTTPGSGLLTEVYKFLVYLLNLSLGQDLNSWVCVCARVCTRLFEFVTGSLCPFFSTFHCCLLIGYWGWWQSLASWGCRGTGANSYNSDLNFHDNRGEDHIYDKGRTWKPKPFTLLHSEAKGASDWKWLKVTEIFALRSFPSCHLGIILICTLLGLGELHN